LKKNKIAGITKSEFYLPSVIMVIYQLLKKKQKFFSKAILNQFHCFLT